MTLWLQALGIARAKVIDRLSDAAQSDPTVFSPEVAAQYVSILDGKDVEHLAKELASQGRCANATCRSDLGSSDAHRASKVMQDDVDSDDEEARREMPRHAGDPDDQSSEDEMTEFERRQRQEATAPTARGRDVNGFDVTERIRLKLPRAIFCSNDCCIAMREAALRGHQLPPQDPLLVQSVKNLFPGLKILSEASEQEARAAPRVADKKKVAFASVLQTEDESTTNDTAAREEVPPRQRAPEERVTQPPATATERRKLPPVNPYTLFRPKAPSVVVPSREALGVLVATVTPFTAFVFQTNFHAYRDRLTPLPWVPITKLSALSSASIPAPTRPPHRRSGTADDMRCTRMQDGLLNELPRAALLLRADLVVNKRIAQLVASFVTKTLAFDTEWTCGSEGFLMLLVALLTAMSATDPDVSKEVSPQVEEVIEFLDATHTSTVVFAELVKMLYGV